MKLVIGADPAVAAWVAARSPLEQPHFERYATIAILDGAARLCGAVVYHEYHPRWGTIQLSGAADSWVCAGPQTAREILAFAFEKLGVQKIWTQSGLSNTRALKLLKAYGFKQEAVLGHEYGSEHCVRMRLFRRDWERSHGRRKAA